MPTSYIEDDEGKVFKVGPQFDPETGDLKKTQATALDKKFWEKNLKDSAEKIILETDISQALSTKEKKRKAKAILEGTVGRPKEG